MDLRNIAVIKPIRYPNIVDPKITSKNDNIAENKLDAIVSLC